MKPIACDLQDLSPPQAALHLRKRPSRFHILLLFFLASAATFSSRTAFRRNCVLDAAAQTNHTHLAPNNATLLRFLASSESADPYGLAEVDDFLRSVFDGDPSPSPALPSLRRLAGREAAGHKATIRARAARWAPALPAFRRAFLSWSSHRRPDPGPVMSDLPSLLPLPRHHGRCAVVGNSGVLLRGSHGPRIDSHDLVIRLNNARVSGFEAHVGRKTDLSFVNSNVFHVCGHHAGCPCHPYGPGVPLVMYICQAHHLLDYVVCAAASGGRPPPPVLLTDPRLDLLCARILKYYSLKRFTESTGRPPEEWGKVHDAAAFHYSSGMEAVVMALGICEEVSLFGFGKVAGARHHYHTSQMKELSLHDYLAEYDFYDDLVRSPEAVPFLGDFGFKVPPVVIYR